MHKNKVFLPHITKNLHTDWPRRVWLSYFHYLIAPDGSIFHKIDSFSVLSDVQHAHSLVWSSRIHLYLDLHLPLKILASQFTRWTFLLVLRGGVQNCGLLTFSTAFCSFAIGFTSRGGGLQSLCSCRSCNTVVIALIFPCSLLTPVKAICRCSEQTCAKSTVGT